MTRLPWFRHGFMPDWLRTRLISNMDSNQHKEVRRVIRELLLTARDKMESEEIEPSRGFELNFTPKTRSDQLSRLKAIVLERIGMEQDENPLNEYIFSSYMTGGTTSRLAVHIPKIVRNLFYRKGQAIFGVRPAAALFLMFFLGLVGFLGLGSMQTFVQKSLPAIPMFHMSDNMHPQGVEAESARSVKSIAEYMNRFLAQRYISPGPDVAWAYRLHFLSYVTWLHATLEQKIGFDAFLFSIDADPTVDKANPNSDWHKKTLFLKTKTEMEILLPRPFRSEAKTLSLDDVTRIIVGYNFSDRFRNETGIFKNDFKDHGDGTVIDRTTGLMWQQSGSNNYMVYDDALKYINSLNHKKFAGYDDWRLPTIEEIASLMEKEKMKEKLHINPIFDNEQWLCWSSDKDSAGSVWVADFNNGNVVRYPSILDYYVRAVRSVRKEVVKEKINEYLKVKPPEVEREQEKKGKSLTQIKLRSKAITTSKDDVERMLVQHNFFERRFNKIGRVNNSFKDHGDGTITDQTTGLMWQRSGHGDFVTYEEALDYIAGLNQKKFLGHEDWRLPTLEELSSLMEPERMSGGLYIDPIFDRKQFWCWSADKGPSGSAWTAGFDDGSVGRLSIFAGIYVRAVRSLKGETD